MTIDGTLPPNGSGADLISTNGLQIDWERGDIPPGNGPVQILYDPSNGNLSVNSPARSVTTFEVISDSGLFIPRISALASLIRHLTSFHLPSYSSFARERAPITTSTSAIYFLHA